MFIKELIFTNVRQDLFHDRKVLPLTLIIMNAEIEIIVKEVKFYIFSSSKELKCIGKKFHYD